MRHSLLNQKYLALSLALFLALLLCTTCTKNGPKGALDAEAWERVIKEGDVVFRRGQGLISTTVTSLDQEGLYSHCGIAVCNAEGTLQILHAVPDEPDSVGDFDRVKCSTVADFFSSEHAISGAIMRTSSPQAATRAAQKAQEVYARATPFDHDYDCADTTRMYCTEFVAHCYAAAGVDLVEGRAEEVSLPFIQRRIIFPSHLAASPHLRLVRSYKL